MGRDRTADSNLQPRPLGSLLGRPASRRPADVAGWGTSCPGAWGRPSARGSGQPRPNAQGSLGRSCLPGASAHTCGRWRRFLSRSPCAAGALSAGDPPIRECGSVAPLPTGGSLLFLPGSWGFCWTRSAEDQHLSWGPGPQAEAQRGGTGAWSGAGEGFCRTRGPRSQAIPIWQQAGTWAKPGLFWFVLFSIRTPKRVG